jgi:hypothetical protein
MLAISWYWSAARILLPGWEKRFAASAALTFFLGQFIRSPAEFAIKLDTDVKAEKEEKKQNAGQSIQNSENSKYKNQNHNKIHLATGG